MTQEQGTNTETEGTEQSKEVEGSTQQKEEPTEKTYSEADFQKAVSTGVSKGLESITRQHDLRKTEADLAKAEAATLKAERDVSQSLQEETQRALTELEEKQFAEDPEALKGFRLTKSLELRDKKANLRDAQQNHREAEQEGLRMAIVLHDKAGELLKQYQVPQKILELCTSEKQMEDIAKDYPEVGAKPEGAPKFAGAGEQGKGADLNKMTAREQIAYAIAHPNK